MTGVQRREQLLEVGRALFAARGLDGTSVEEVALRAGVSKPVVYDHFGGKEGLYAVVVEREVQRLRIRLGAALTGESPRQLVEQAARALLSYVEEEPVGFGVLVRESPAPPAGSGGATILGDVGRQVEHLLVRQLAARGCRTAFTGLYAQALLGQAALVGQWWLDHPEHGRDEVAAHLVNLTWNGLAGLQADPRLTTACSAPTAVGGPVSPRLAGGPDLRPGA